MPLPPLAITVGEIALLLALFIIVNVVLLAPLVVAVIGALGDYAQNQAIRRGEVPINPTGSGEGAGGDRAASPVVPVNRL
jgi:hypothetical protein